MDPQIIAAIIGGVATVAAAVIATVLGIRAGRRRGGTESSGASTQSDSPQAARPPRTGGPQTHIVDPVDGDHTTISEAIRAAAPGDKIHVRPGIYREGIVVRKPLDIVGDGNANEVIVHSDGQSALRFDTTVGSVRNLTLRQVDSATQVFAVAITQGRLTLTQCDISNSSISGVGIFGSANPTLRGNRIHGSKEAGILVNKNGKGTLEDNDIFGNSFPGIQVSGGDATVRRNKIHDNYKGLGLMGTGISVYFSTGTFEDNVVSGQSWLGVVDQNIHFDKDSAQSFTRARNKRNGKTID